MRRYRIAVSVAGSFLLIVMVSACVAWGLYLSAEQSWRQEEETSRQLRETSAKHLEASKNYRLASEKYQRERDIAEGLRKEGNQKLYYAKMILAGQAANTPGGNQVVADLTSQWKPEKDGIDHRDWEWFYLSSQCNRELTSSTQQIQGLSIARWSHDGKRLAVGGYRALRLFDENLTREPLVEIQHKRELLSLAWNHDDTRLATGGTNEQIYIWDTSNDSLKLMSGIPLNGRIDGLCWSPDGAELAAMNHLGALRIWNVDEGKRVAKIDGLRSGRFSVSWHPDGELLAIADGGSVKIIKKDGEVLTSLEKTGNEIRAVAWNCFGTRLAVVAGDGRTIVWDITTGKEVWSDEGGGELEDVVWMPDNDKMLATASRDRSVRVFDTQSGYVIREIKGHGGAVRSVDWHPSGDRLVTTNRDNVVRIWPVSNEGSSHAIRYYSRFETKRIECSPDGKLLACVGIGPKVKFIRTDNEEIRHVLHPGYCHALAWKPGKQTIASAASDGTVRLWTEDASEPILVFDGHANESADNNSVLCVDWSPDGKHIVSGDWQKKAIIWSAETGEILNEFTHHKVRLEVARWHPTRSLIISGSTIGRIMIWDAMTGEVHREMPADMKACLDIRWNAAGDQFATASMDSLARIWQLDQEAPKFLLKGHSGPVRCVQWHPSGTRIATSSDDGKVKVWSTESGDEVLTIQVSDDPVWGIDWSIDGEKLYSASDDGIIRVWDSSYGYQQQRPDIDRAKGK